MNKKLTNDRLNPKSVIVVYADHYNSNFYLEQRDIVTVSGKQSLAAPVPMAEDIIKDISKSYMKKSSADMNFNGLIPEHILYASNKPGKTVVVWYRPAMKRGLNFGKMINSKDDTIVASVPPTLYVVINKDLYIFSLPNDNRPSSSTKLYGAPFFNIYKDGKVCLGSAHVGKVKAKSFELELERFERGFYMAQQTSVHDNTTKTDLLTLWKTLSGKDIPFPKKELKAHSKYKTVFDLFDKLIGNG